MLNSDGHFERLQELAEKSSVLPFFRDLVSIERKAESIRTYESYIMPGLCQTEDYARTAIGASRPMLSGDEIDRAVLLRMSRQEILDGDDPLRLWAIIDESILRRRVGSPGLMSEQCRHLLMMGRRPHLTIQVISEKKGVTSAYGASFMVLTFPGSKPPLAYIDDARSARYIHERNEVGAYSATFDYLRSSAMDDEDSAAMIRSYQDEYEAELA